MESKDIADGIIDISGGVEVQRHLSAYPRTLNAMIGLHWVWHNSHFAHSAKPDGMVVAFRTSSSITTPDQDIGGSVS